MKEEERGSRKYSSQTEGRGKKILILYEEENTDTLMFVYYSFCVLSHAYIDKFSVKSFLDVVE